jgi:bifunctional UDP-N-acetylglucosamine pyrophosphorylase/glucosamine-1-phosphate N-acetyltransferase
MSKLAVIVLAAGKGSRMKSAKPKVLHEVCGVPMAAHVLAAARELKPDRLIVVVGFEAEMVRAALPGDDLLFVEQTELLGTGDAVRRCRIATAGCDGVMVLNGDSPLISSVSLQRLVAARQGAPLALLSSEVPDSGSFGRVRTDDYGAVTGIDEAFDVDEPGRTVLRNTGQYVFDAAWLWDHIDGIPLAAKGEYFLTELPAMAHAEGRPGVCVPAPLEEVDGFDDRVGLARAEAAMRRRILERHMLDGVTIADPATTYIDATVRIEADVTILQNCWLTGATTIATGARIGPGTTLRNSHVGANTQVQASVIEESVLGEDVHVGPFAHVRGSSRIGDGCYLGNYAEVNRSTLGRGVKMHHFSYLGDATVGDGVNYAAGAVTNNYDGVNKNATIIGRGAFIGCDTMLIAPVEVGDEARTGSGAVVNRDVPAGVTVVGVPARPLVKRGER